jgi:nitrite reductase/ring-hydroxylating ferredoxin subunit
MAFTRVGASSDVRVGRGCAFAVDDTRIVVFRLGEELHALPDACPHRGASLSEGAVVDGAVRCPKHRWRFDLATGACTEAPHIPAQVLPVREEDGAVWVDLEGAK